MSLKQIFCTHIWESVGGKEIDSYIRYYNGFPLYYVTVHAFKYKCLKCAKETLEEETHQRKLNLDEIKTILNVDRSFEKWSSEQ